VLLMCIQSATDALLSQQRDNIPHTLATTIARDLSTMDPRVNRAAAHGRGVSRVSTASMNRIAVDLALVLFGAVAGTTTAFATDSLGFYIGAGVGEGHVRTDNAAFGSTNDGVVALGRYQFDKQHSAWKLMAGVRPIPLLGVELEYVDFGNPRTGYLHDSSIGFTLADSNADAKAGAVFGLGYLPLPVPFLDIYAKLGVARLHTTSTEVPALPFSCPAFIPCFPRGSVFHQSDWSTDLAYGLGAQGTFRRLNVLAEYERISMSGGDPDMLSLSITWTL
jgi:hypothetical protein